MGNGAVKLMPMMEMRDKIGSQDVNAKTKNDKADFPPFCSPTQAILPPLPTTPYHGKNDVIIVTHASGAITSCQAVTSLSRSERNSVGKRGGVIRLISSADSWSPRGRVLRLRCWGWEKRLCRSMLTLM